MKDIELTGRFWLAMLAAGIIGFSAGLGCEDVMVEAEAGLRTPTAVMICDPVNRNDCVRVSGGRLR